MKQSQLQHNFNNIFWGCQTEFLLKRKCHNPNISTYVLSVRIQTERRAYCNLKECREEGFFKTNKMHEVYLKEMIAIHEGVWYSIPETIFLSRYFILLIFLWMHPHGRTIFTKYLIYFELVEIFNFSFGLPNKSLGVFADFLNIFQNW